MKLENTWFGIETLIVFCSDDARLLFFCAWNTKKKNVTAAGFVSRDQ